MPRDVDYREIADKIAEELQAEGMPVNKKMIRMFTRSFITSMFRVMRSRRSRINLRGYDIHTFFISPPRSRP